MRDQGSGISSMRYVLWPGALALAAWLFIEGLEARDQHAETRGLIDSTSRQIQDVQRHNDRTRAEIEGIEGDDPVTLRKKLQESNWVLRGNKQVLEAGDQRPGLRDRPAGDGK